MFKKAFFFLLTIVAFYSTASSQSDTISQRVSGIDNRLYALTEAQARQLFDEAFFNPYGYINGKEYKPYHMPGKSTPFLKENYGTGSISYDGRTYSDLHLLYDISLDELLNIPKLISLANYYVKINKDLIDSFTINLDNETFQLKHLWFEKNTSIPMEEGFYEIPYQGNTIHYLIKHRVVSNTNSGYPNFTYSPISYFVRNGDYFRVNTKGSFLKLFPENKKQVKKKMKTYYKSFRSMSKAEVIEILQFAESL